MSKTRCSAGLSVRVRLPVNGVIDAKTLKFLYEEADPDGYPETLIEGGETEPVEPGQDSLDEAAVVARVTDRAIVISVGERALGLYEGNQLIKRYPVAIGKPSTPTPVGTHRVLEKVLHPGGALGTRWIGFTYQMHGIHGTNRPELIGQAVSNGCVRMHNSHVEELYEMVGLGAPVIVIVAPVASWSGLGKSPSQAGRAGLLRSVTDWDRLRRNGKARRIPGPFRPAAKRPYGCKRGTGYCRRDLPRLRTGSYLYGPARRQHLGNRQTFWDYCRSDSANHWHQKPRTHLSGRGS